MTFYLQLMRNKWLSPTGNILFQLENIKILKGWESPPPYLLQAGRKKGKMRCDLDCELCGGWERFPWHGFRPRCSAPCPGRHVNIAPCLLSSALFFSSPCRSVTMQLNYPIPSFSFFQFIFNCSEIGDSIVSTIMTGHFMEILMEQKDDWLKIIHAASRCVRISFNF